MKVDDSDSRLCITPQRIEVSFMLDSWTIS